MSEAQTGILSGRMTSTVTLRGTISNSDMQLVGSAAITEIYGQEDYEKLSNLPSINSVTLIGNKSLSDLGISNTLSHCLSIGSYRFDGSEDVTIPTYQGETSGNENASTDTPVLMSMTEDSPQMQMLDTAQQMQILSDTMQMIQSDNQMQMF